MKKYCKPAMDVIALNNTVTLLNGSVPGLGGNLDNSDPILAPGMGDLPPGIGDDLMNSILPPGMGNVLGR